jgi:hypothetical protein
MERRKKAQNPALAGIVSMPMARDIQDGDANAELGLHEGRFQTEALELAGADGVVGLQHGFDAWKGVGKSEDGALGRWQRLG